MSRNPYAAQWQQFADSTKDHQLTVEHDDGLYRHYRMRKPGTGIWSWNVVTWPWHMYVGGDIGQGFVFSREEDMIGFFQLGAYSDYWGDGSLWINPGYWAEKLDHACRDRAFSYDEDRFLSQVRAVLDDRLTIDELGADRVAELRAEADEARGSEESAREWLYARDEFGDSWEWDLKGFDHHFLLACYAIAATVKAVTRLTDQSPLEVSA